MASKPRTPSVVLLDPAKLPAELRTRLKDAENRLNFKKSELERIRREKLEEEEKDQSVQDMDRTLELIRQRKLLMQEVAKLKKEFSAVEDEAKRVQGIEVSKRPAAAGKKYGAAAVKKQQTEDKPAVVAPKFKFQRKALEEKQKKEEKEKEKEKEKNENENVEKNVVPAEQIVGHQNAEAEKNNEVLEKVEYKEEIVQKGEDIAAAVQSEVKNEEIVAESKEENKEKDVVSNDLAVDEFPPPPPPAQDDFDQQRNSSASNADLKRTQSGSFADPRMARKLSRAKEPPKEVAPIVPLGANLYMDNAKKTAQKLRSTSEAPEPNQLAKSDENGMRRTYSMGSRLNLEMDDEDWIDPDAIPFCLSCGQEVSITKVDKYGWMSKKRAGLFQLVAHDRWFCLIGSHLLYWSDESGFGNRAPRGIFHLGDYALEEGEGFSLTLMELDTKSRVVLKSKTQEDHQAWIKLFQNVKVLRK
jgi:hypothetical protein